MKFLINDDKITIYSNNKYLRKDCNLNFLEDYIKAIIKKINKRYDIELNYFLEINIYRNQYYGVIIEITNTETDYYHYYDTDDYEFKINILDVHFLYEVNDFTLKNKNFNYYVADDKIYIKIINEISDKQMSELLEHAKLIYQTKDLYEKKVNI